MGINWKKNLKLTPRSWRDSFTYRLLSKQKSQSGVALLLAIFTMVIISFLVVEISYESNVEYIVNGNSVNRVQAYYAARSGLDFALLRLKIYQKAQGQFGNLPPAQKKLLDLIWQFPLNWPLAIPGVELPPTPSQSADEDSESSGLSGPSLMEATWATQIVDEGSKIDINDLDSPSKGLKDATRDLILGIFENKKENDEDFRRKYQDFKFEELVNNIIDWLDADVTAINGGDERQFYEVKVENVRLPPNRSFRTVDEVRLVYGMNEELFGLLRDRITVYGMKAINPNYATAEVLKAIHSSMDDETVSAVISRRDNEKEGGPYADANDFWGYVQSKQRRGTVPPEVQQNLPLVFDAVYNFKIVATGEKTGQIREITAITFDLDSAASTVAERLQNEAQNPSGSGAGGSGSGGGSGTGGSGSGTGSKNNKKKQTPSKGPPRIVYFLER